MATLVLPVVDKPSKIPVVQFKVLFIAPPNDVILPETSKVVEGFVFPFPNLVLTLSYVKFWLCKIDVFEFPINIWLAVNVAAPVPPWEIDNVPDVILDAFKEVKPLPFTDIVPDVILDAFKEVNAAPEPEKVEADTDVIEQVVPVKPPDNVPPVKGKNNDNVEDIGVPFLYISEQFI